MYSSQMYLAGLRLVLEKFIGSASDKTIQPDPYLKNTWLLVRSFIHDGKLNPPKGKDKQRILETMTQSSAYGFIQAYDKLNGYSIQLPIDCYELCGFVEAVLANNFPQSTGQEQKKRRQLLPFRSGPIFEDLDSPKDSDLRIGWDDEEDVKTMRNLLSLGGFQPVSRPEDEILKFWKYSFGGE
jgi:hypothetical protein